VAKELTLAKNDSRALANRVAAAALEKKAGDVLILDLRKLETMADYFVIATGDVDQHVRAIVRNIEDQVKQNLGERVMHREGMETYNWVLLDYVDVVVHVFKPSFREFYRLEDLWSDAEAISVTAEGPAPRAKPARRRLAEVKPAASKTTSRESAASKADKPTRAAAKPRVKKEPTAKAAKPKAAKPKAARKTTRIPKILEAPKAPRKRTTKSKA
jgi:ribosome-associated protein